MRLSANGGTRLSYYNYTVEVKILHITLLLVLFYISMLFIYMYINEKERCRDG